MIEPHHYLRQKLAVDYNFWGFTPLHQAVSIALSLGRCARTLGAFAIQVVFGQREWEKLLFEVTGTIGFRVDVGMGE